MLIKSQFLLSKEPDMGERTTVKVSKRYQFAVPSLVRRRLNIESGDELLIDVQGSIALIMPIICPV